MSEEEEYLDDEYLDENNDPFEVNVIIDEEDSLPLENQEEIISLDKIIASAKGRSAESMRIHDKIMEKKMISYLKGEKLEN